ncbi:response regulator transcription factor [Pseudomonas typographi]|uniref:Response regulator transcription factor n=1 Tax=Pseudomonas typographi TaxID=2715964 RepID=A0ABR7Z0A9_9PSED|nr:response regulator transcription factor [Pseudomonas typographi]MBD1551354.1 response regulator transcription factor [Pseudomonas typographi]MBD1588764.1 response regulator transcription factor [Pseudomonas typographi]MBD1598880.1 response regulator transcription factor [Pseudomonas typographi]
MTIYILLADDHRVTLAGITQALNEASRERLRVRACVNGTDALFHTLGRQRFDLLITDFSMPGGQQPDGVPMLARLRQQFSQLPILVLTALREACTLGAVLATGVAGVISKQATPEALRLAALRVAAGRRYLCSDVQNVLAQRYLHKAAWAQEGTTVLTEREKQVMDLARHGLPVRQIAQRLGRSEKSVIVQRRNAFEKLGLRPDALIYHHPPRELIAG